MQANGPLPPYCPEAERGVLGCCLLDIGKVTDITALLAATENLDFVLRNLPPIQPFVEWRRICAEEHGVSKTQFFKLIKRLEEAQKVAKSPIDGKWEQIRKPSRNYGNEKDQ